MNLQRQLVLGFALITTVGSLGWLPTLVGNPEGGKEGNQKQPTPARSELRSDATPRVEHHSFLFGDLDRLWISGNLDQAVDAAQALLPSLSPSDQVSGELKLAQIMSDANRQSEAIELLTKRRAGFQAVQDQRIAGIAENNLGIQYLVESECAIDESEKRNLLAQSLKSLEKAEGLLGISKSDQAVCLQNQATVAFCAGDRVRSEVLKEGARKLFDQCSGVGKL